MAGPGSPLPPGPPPPPPATRSTPSPAAMVPWPMGRVLLIMGLLKTALAAPKPGAARAPWPMVAPPPPLPVPPGAEGPSSAGPRQAGPSSSGQPRQKAMPRPRVGAPWGGHAPDAPPKRKPTIRLITLGMMTGPRPAESWHPAGALGELCVGQGRRPKAGAANARQSRLDDGFHCFGTTTANSRSESSGCLT